jgi:hypothetical protein
LSQYSDRAIGRFAEERWNLRDAGVDVVGHGVTQRQTRLTQATTQNKRRFVVLFKYSNPSQRTAGDGGGKCSPGFATILDGSGGDRSTDTCRSLIVASGNPNAFGSGQAARFHDICAFAKLAAQTTASARQLCCIAAWFAQLLFGMDREQILASPVNLIHHHVVNPRKRASHRSDLDAYRVDG